MSEPVTCADCRYFRPDAQNPTAAMGRCLHDARHGWFFAAEPHRCADHSQEPRYPMRPHYCRQREQEEA